MITPVLPYTVYVMNGELVVGHIASPQRPSHMMWQERQSGKATCEVIGRRKFRDGLEVPCLDYFAGNECLVHKAYMYVYHALMYDCQKVGLIAMYTY